MAKLINILAASVGGGLMLGAGIRLGEALAGREAAPGRVRETDGTVATRLGSLESRLALLESERHIPAVEEVSAARSVMEKQASEVEAKLDALSENSLRLRGDLHNWLEDNVNSRMTDLESRLRSESEQIQRKMLDAFVEGVQTRVMHRIAKLEDELANQSAAMTELRECSIRTEQSMQKLLGGLDRLIIAQQAPDAGSQSTGQPHSAANGSEAGTTDAEEKPPAEPSRAEALPRSKRWAIFG